MKTYTLDGARFQDQNSMHEHLMSVFEFPSYYGKNLDAFWDCIRERKSGRIRVQNANKADPELLLSFFNVIMDLCRLDSNWKAEIYSSEKKKCIFG